METFILNMPKREDRKASIVNEFADKTDFTLHFCTPIHHLIPATSHWLSFRDVVKRAKEMNLSAFLFCEDDHMFTKEFNRPRFSCLIDETVRLDADMFLGGVSWMQSPIQISKQLFWLDRFNGIQFAVIFNRFYDRIIKSKTAGDAVTTEIVLSQLSDRIFTTFPPISVQKEFGYSDVTHQNNQKGYVESLFKGTAHKLCMLNKVRDFYNSLKCTEDKNAKWQI